MERQEGAALPDVDLGGSLSAEQQHDKELGKYSRAKRDTAAFVNFIIKKKPELAKNNIVSGNVSGLARIVQQVSCCADRLAFHAYYQHGNIHRLVGGFTCKHALWCLGCALRRSARLAKTYLKHFQRLLQADPDLVPVLITWTVKHGPDLKERFEHLRSAQRFMLDRRRRAQNNQKYSFPTPLRFLKGGAGSYEFKRGRNSGQFNFHIHEVALIDRREHVFTEQLRPVRMKKGDTVQTYKLVYVPLELEGLLCQELWLTTGDSFVADVRGLYPRDKYTRLDGLSGDDLAKPLFNPPCDDEDNPDAPDSLFSGLCEAFKYTVKPDELSHEDWLAVATYLQRRRLFYSYGLLRSVKVPEDNSDDREDWMLDAPFIEKIYKYYSREKCYQLEKIHDQKEALFVSRGTSGRKSFPKKRCPLVSPSIRESVAAFIKQLPSQKEPPPF